MEIEYADSYRYLGIWLNQHCDMRLAVKELLKSASRALGFLLHKYYTCGDMHFNVFTRLFDSLIQPVLTYCSGIWGVNKYQEMYTIQRRAARAFLGVSRNTPNIAVRGDMGWPDPQHRVYLEAARLWCRLERLPQGIQLEFEGKAYVHWSERHRTGSGSNRRTVTRHYSAKEKYFDQKILLTGRWKEQSGEDMYLPPGSHTFPFALQLPPQLPSSFEGRHGHVRYTVQAKIDKPWKFDHKTKRPFTVICLLDLNREPTAASPVQSSDSKTLCCLCCASGPINATFTLDRRGYVPGEAIMLKAEIDNQSSRRMDSSSVVMTMSTIFHATRKSKTTNRVIAKLRHGEIGPGDCHYWNGDLLVIPPLPPSYLAGCRIIDIRYTVKLEVDPAGIGFDLEVPLEVIIGTIPLQHVVAQNPPTAPPGMLMPAPGPAPQPPASYPPRAKDYAPEEPSQPAAPPPYPAGATTAPNMPPPSYEECVFGKVNIKEDEDGDYMYGDKQYAPVYTYYNWGHTPSAPPPPPPQEEEEIIDDD